MMRNLLLGNKHRPRCGQGGPATVSLYAVSDLVSRVLSTSSTYRMGVINSSFTTATADLHYSSIISSYPCMCFDRKHSWHTCNCWNAFRGMSFGVEAAGNLCMGWLTQWVVFYDHNSSNSKSSIYLAHPTAGNYQICKHYSYSWGSTYWISLLVSIVRSAKKLDGNRERNNGKFGSQRSKPWMFSYNSK